MQVKNAMQIKNGKGKGKTEGFNSFTQPIQFLSREEKDPDWGMHNMDWLEWQGIQQVSTTARRLMKNYKLAKGTIDREDYINGAEEAPSDISELVDILSTDSVQAYDNDSAFDIKFYPIIPNIVNVLVAEFAKRNTKIDYRAEDEYSYNEIMDAKMKEIEGALMEDAMGKLQKKMVDAGLDPESPEAQEQFDPEALKRLPEIEEFYSKTYQTLGEQWAAKQHKVDVARFRMDELEEIAFRDMLITDREFWHFRMLEDDYEVELWNPALVFYHKTPDVRYISQGNWVGKLDMLTISDVIDKYGSLMTEEQMRALELFHPVRAGRYMLDNVSNDSYYNPEVSHAENLDPSLNMKRWLSYNENAYNPDDIVSWIVGQSEHTGILQDDQMVRVTTAYWKTQRKVGYLTSVNEGGEVTVDIVDESYMVANNPIYNTKIKTKRSAENLVFGDHIEWIWINQTYGGVKIGPNRMMFTDAGENDRFTPMYLGIESPDVGPLRFQFKGEQSLYGCKLPVEGKIFTERNTKSSGMVDLLMPSQIGFNLVNNQMADILIDEIGPVIALDQNALPQHSLGEDWGKANYAKAYTAMKDFNILPLDTSISNTENALNFQHYQQLNLEQGNRLQSRMQLAQFFKQQALEVIGITPQRLGQQIGQTDTATGVEQAVAGSYAQTETYFIQHSDHLMPRVHQMRTDLAQYYHSKRPSIRLQSMVSPDERKFFEINGVDLLLIDINVYCNTNANTRAAMQKIQQMAMQNNTSGATISDLGEVLQAESLGSLNHILKDMDKKANEKAQADQQHAKEIQAAEAEARQKELQMENDHDWKMQESKNRNNTLNTKIKAAGFGAMQDINENKVSDFQDVLKDIEKTSAHEDTMNFNRDKEANTTKLGERRLDIEQQKVDVAKQDSENKVTIARENTSKSEINAKKSAKANKKK
jgi:hypothetical protein